MRVCMLLYNICLLLAYNYTYYLLILLASTGIVCMAKSIWGSGSRNGTNIHRWTTLRRALVHLVFHWFDSAFSPYHTPFSLPFLSPPLPSAHSAWAVTAVLLCGCGTYYILRKYTYTRTHVALVYIDVAQMVCQSHHTAYTFKRSNGTGQDIYMYHTTTATQITLE